MLGAYWVNFTTAGDPNGKGLPQWAPFTSKSAVTMELGDKPGPPTLLPDQKQPPIAPMGECKTPFMLGYLLS
jgi:carboxylesterase type B